MKLTTLRPRIATLGTDLRIGNSDRPNARGRGYTSRWEVAAAAFKRTNPHCLGCKAINRIVATEVVDHTIPHHGDHEVFWNAAAWQPACRWHHDVVKQVLEGMQERGIIDTSALWLDSKWAITITNRELKAKGD